MKLASNTLTKNSHLFLAGHPQKIQVKPNSTIKGQKHEIFYLNIYPNSLLHLKNALMAKLDNDEHYPSNNSFDEFYLIFMNSIFS